MHEVEKDIALSLGLPSPQEKVERREIESDETSSCLARTQLKDLGRRTPPYIIGTFYFLGVNLVARGVEANSRLIASITFARCSGLRRFIALFSFCVVSGSGFVLFRPAVCLHSMSIRGRVWSGESAVFWQEELG
jgi:hypothetical protein